jgi:hypothetical protein
LHAVYRYFGRELPLEQVVAEVPQLDEGGTLAVVLGCHALAQGFSAAIYTFNLQVFDPTWFGDKPVDLSERLEAQVAVKTSRKLRVATRSYLEFLRLGGSIRMHDLTSELIARYLNRGVPILIGLSATYLYHEAREVGMESRRDDVRGVPVGHFVVLCGYDRLRRQVLVADPLLPNPMAEEQLYRVGIDRVKCAILLGVMTYDANLLIIQPRTQDKGHGRADRNRRR